MEKDETDLELEFLNVIYEIRKRALCGDNVHPRGRNCD
jgi:hypothetical protein